MHQSTGPAVYLILKQSGSKLPSWLLAAACYSRRPQRQGRHLRLGQGDHHHHGPWQPSGTLQ